MFLSGLSVAWSSGWLRLVGTADLCSGAGSHRVLDRRIVLFGAPPSFFFLHLCGGYPPSVWDTVHGFELRIYVSGGPSWLRGVVLTVAAWVAGA